MSEINIREIIIDFPVAIKMGSIVVGLGVKTLGYAANIVSNTVGNQLHKVGDHYLSFGTTWGLTEVANWISGKNEEAASFIDLGKKNAVLLIASPALGLVALRILAGTLGLGAKAAGQAAHFAGYDYLKKHLDNSSDSMISFATKKIETDLKIGAALTAVAAIVLLQKIESPIV